MNNTIDEQLAFHKAEIAKLEKQRDETWPKDGDVIWHNTYSSPAFKSTFSRRYIPMSKRGMIFRTEAEARRFDERLRVAHELAELGKHWKPDWSNMWQEKWHPAYNHGIRKFDLYDSYYSQQWPYQYFPTKESLRDAMDKLGDRLLVLFDTEGAM